MPDKTGTDLIHEQLRRGQYYITVWHAEEYQRRPYGYWDWDGLRVIGYDTAKDAEKVAVELRTYARYRSPIVVPVR